jgi:hypothetical protein
MAIVAARRQSIETSHPWWRRIPVWSQGLSQATRLQCLWGGGGVIHPSGGLYRPASRVLLWAPILGLLHASRSDRGRGTGGHAAAGRAPQHRRGRRRHRLRPRRAALQAGAGTWRHSIAVPAGGPARLGRRGVLGWWARRRARPLHGGLPAGSHPRSSVSGSRSIAGQGARCSTMYFEQRPSASA